jgi:uncharacterized membrane protein YhaH (DUF805 family)
MNSYLATLKKYAVFDGRAQRKEYWLFVLFNLIIAVVLSFVDRMTGTYSADYGMGALGAAYALAVLLPGIGVSVRRLHDTDRSGWWLLIVFIPILGALVLLVFMILDGTPGTNRFGPNPKEAAA